MLTKSRLAIILSGLEQFDSPKVLLEQYSTEPEIAAEVLWFAFMQGDIKEKRIADLGCGPGILGIGAGLLGASEVVFVDMDKVALNATARNIEKVSEGLKGVRIKLVESPVQTFEGKYDVVLQNPPFGTKIRHHDKIFLGVAFKTAPIVYSIHKRESQGFIEAFAKDSGFRVTHTLPFTMRLGRTMKSHKKPLVKVEVACWRLVKATTG